MVRASGDGRNDYLNDLRRKNLSVGNGVENRLGNEASVCPGVE